MYVGMYEVMAARSEPCLFFIHKRDREPRDGTRRLVSISEETDGGAEPRRERKTLFLHLRGRVEEICFVFFIPFVLLVFLSRSALFDSRTPQLIFH